MNQRSRGTADEDVLNLAYRELDAYRVDRRVPRLHALCNIPMVTGRITVSHSPVRLEVAVDGPMVVRRRCGHGA